MALEEYPEGSPFPGVIGRTFDESFAGVAAAAPRQRGSAERSLYRSRRYRLRADGVLRRSH